MGEGARTRDFKQSTNRRGTSPWQPPRLARAPWPRSPLNMSNEKLTVKTGTVSLPVLTSHLQDVCVGETTYPRVIGNANMVAASRLRGAGGLGPQTSTTRLEKDQN